MILDEFLMNKTDYCKLYHNTIHLSNISNYNNIVIFIILRYLYRVGLKRAKSLLVSSGDTDLLEKIMILLTWNKNNLIENYQTNMQQQDILKEEKEDIIEKSVMKTEEMKHETFEDSMEQMNINTTKEEKPVKTEEELLNDIKIRANWLCTLSECDKFELTTRFLSQELLHNIIDILNTIHTNSNSSNYHDVIMKYSTGLKI